MSINFRVTGLPKPQPRPRAFARKMGDKFVARVFESGSAEGWKSLVAVAAKPHTPPEPMSGPVLVNITFVFPRPNSHYVSNNPAKPLRKDAPHWHVSQQRRRERARKNFRRAAEIADARYVSMAEAFTIMRRARGVQVYHGYATGEYP